MFSYSSFCEQDRLRADETYCHRLKESLFQIGFWERLYHQINEIKENPENAKSRMCVREGELARVNLRARDLLGDKNNL